MDRSLKIAIAILFFSIIVLFLGIARHVYPELFVNTILNTTPETAQDISDTSPKETEPTIIPVPIVEEVRTIQSEYIEVIDSCDQYFRGPCLNARSGPGVNFPVITKLRTGIVLKISDTTETDGVLWYKVDFDEWLRYPERVKDDLYVASTYVKKFDGYGVENISVGENSSSTKYILVDRGDQMLYAYDGEELFMKEKISTGIELTPTPRGTFTIFKKTPTRYMQGPIPGISEKEYDLPGVPWNLYFTHEGAVIHGTYWHDNFGKRWSSGCVNLPPEKAKELYDWADVGVKVIVRD